jgi:hypothetical protein
VRLIAVPARLRSLRPATVRPATAAALALAVIFGGAGLAGASNGGALTLGQSSHESSTASLVASRGTPLSLLAPKGKAPLAVNRDVEVRDLNAQYLGGLTAASLRLTGGDGFTMPNADIALSHDLYTGVARTGSLAAGIYYARGSALIDLTVGDTAGFCSIQENGSDLTDFGDGGGDGENYVQAAETAVIRLKSPGYIQESCIAVGTGSGTEVINAGLVAIRIVSSTGTPPGGGGSLAVHG